jgi:hypothetical protein
LKQAHKKIENNKKESTLKESQHTKRAHSVQNKARHKEQFKRHPKITALTSIT